MPDASRIAERIRSAVFPHLRPPGRATTPERARAAAERAERLGVFLVGYHSDDDDIARWEAELWKSQDDLVEVLSREWRQHLYYAAGHQYIAYHRMLRRWVVRRALPWRIRSVYNIVQKAVNLRVARLTENKPAVTVQAATGEQADVDAAEYKESLFWALWDILGLHRKIIDARRWAALTGSGFLKVGFNPEAGPQRIATRMVPRYETVRTRLRNPATGEEEELEESVYAGLTEFYIDRAGNELGPVFAETVAEDGSSRLQKQPPPEAAAYYHEGEVTVDVRSPFSVRWDRYTDDIHESWWVQDAEILPASQVLALWPDARKALEEAQPAGDDEKLVRWAGLHPRAENVEGLGYVERREDKRPFDPEYLVRETWIWPRNETLRRLWGSKGALLVTVGGKLVQKSELPAWALDTSPFIQFLEVPEPGNHYGKSPLRDLLPIQDDINRARSHMAEAIAIRSRIVLGAPQNHGLNLRLLSSMPGVLLTYRSPEHRPTPLDLGRGAEGAENFYQASLSAAWDLGNMNEATTGKLPSAGLAARAIFALQYADERSLAEASALQDIALSRLARAMDAVTRYEYTEPRKIRIVGADRSFLVERELRPEHLQVEVDYRFLPGSMLTRQKEAVKNEMLTLLERGLIERWEVRKYIATAVPDVWRRSYDLQEASARRILERVIRGEEEAVPAPWQDSQVHAAVLEEFMLTRRFELLAEDQRQRVIQLWQAYRLAQAPEQPEPSPAGAPPGAAVGEPAAAAPSGARAESFPVPAGAEALAREAEAAEQPPPGYATPPPVA